VTVRRRLQHGSIGVALGLAALALLLEFTHIVRSSPDESHQLSFSSSDGKQEARFACDQAAAFLHPEAKLLAVAGDGSSAECRWRLVADDVEGTDCPDGRPPLEEYEVLMANVKDGVVLDLSRSDAVVQRCP
jgi:hypothetical protein